MGAKLTANTLKALISDFTQTLQVDWRPGEDILGVASAAIEGCQGYRLAPRAVRERELLALVNWKLRLNRAGVQRFFDEAAARRVVLNYHDKNQVQACFDRNDRKRYRSRSPEHGKSRRRY